MSGAQWCTLPIKTRKDFDSQGLSTDQATWTLISTSHISDDRTDVDNLKSLLWHREKVLVKNDISPRTMDTKQMSCWYDFHTVDSILCRSPVASFIIIGFTILIKIYGHVIVALAMVSTWCWCVFALFYVYMMCVVQRHFGIAARVCVLV